MAEDINNDDVELLGELGVDTKTESTGGRTAKEQRIIAGFEEIERFVEEQGRLPQHGEDRDIFERQYAMRLERIKESSECRSVLIGLDARGLLGPAADTNLDPTPTDDTILAALGIDKAAVADVTKLIHVRPREEIESAEEIAQRYPCKDFVQFKHVFEKIQGDIALAYRRTIPYKDNANIKVGDLFILDGQKVIVANMGEIFLSNHGRPDRRLRVVYDNRTESNLLLRSLQRALNKDKVSRRITEPDFGPLFSDKIDEDDVVSGWIYVLRSKSDHPYVAQHRDVLHKIGVTSGDVAKRIANAKKDPTFLLADVEIVATFKLSNIDRVKLESLLHKFFAEARLDVELKDRFGESVAPREWFSVPLKTIEEVVQKIIDGTILKYRYDAVTAQLVDAKK
jgi:hypothetical protein